jgi:C_GCAxxG_C_C family probable redox protein
MNDMESSQVYAQRARENFLEGYNCSQSVVAAFCDVLKLDRQQALRMASSFGGGMGRLREVCGCVSGMFMIVGFLYGYDDPKAYEGKRELYGRIQDLAGQFKKANGSIICRELLGVAGQDHSPIPGKRTEEYYKKRPCPNLAAFTAELLAEYIQANPPKFNE